MEHEPDQITNQLNEAHKEFSKGMADASKFLVAYAEHMTKAVNELTEAFANIAEYINSEVLPSFVENMKNIYEAIYDIYLQDGAPYGKSKRGFNKWLKERAKENDYPN